MTNHYFEADLVLQMAWELFFGCKVRNSAQSPNLASIIECLLFFDLLTAIFALFLYSYILLCFCCRPKGSSLKPGQWLKIGVCFGVITICCSTIICELFLRFFHLLKPEKLKIIVGSILFSTHSHFTISTSFFLPALLSAYRYYCICKPMKQYLKVFSSRRIRNYFLGYFLTSTLMIILKECILRFIVNSCIILSFCATSFALNNFFYISCLLSTVYFNIKASKKLQGKISRERELLRRNFSLYFDPSSDWSEHQISSRAEFYRSCENETFKEEIHYLKSIRFYAMIFTPILILRYLFWIIISVNGLIYDTYFPATMYGQIVVDVDLIIFVSLGTLLKLTFVFFAQVNEDFKLRVLQPLKKIGLFDRINPPKEWKDIEVEPILKVTIKSSRANTSIRRL